MSLSRSSNLFHSWSRRHTVVLLCFVGILICFIDRVAMSVAIVPMAEQYGWDRETQGLILSSFFIGYLATQILGGHLADRFGGKLLLGLAVFIWSVFTLATVPAATLGIVSLLLVRIGMGLGEGMAFPSIFSLFSHCLPVEERTRAVGFVASAVALGTVLALLISPGIAKFMGWQWIFYIFGFIGFLWCVIWYCFDINPRSTNADVESHISAHDGKGIADVEAAVTVPWRIMMSNTGVWAIIISSFCLAWAGFTLTAWLPSFLAEKSDIEFQSIGLLAMLPFLAAFIGSNFIGWLTDFLIVRRGQPVRRIRYIMETLGAGGLGVALLLVAYAESAETAVVLMTFGLGCSAFTVGGHVINLYDLAPEHAGLLRGLIGTASSIPGVVGIYLGGVLLQVFGDWALVFQVAAVINLAGLVFYWAFADFSPILGNTERSSMDFTEITDT